MCATIEELLNLSDKGWQEIAEMSDEQLQVYLGDISNLENKIKTSTIYKNKEDENNACRDDSSNTSNDNVDEGDSDDALAALKKSVEDSDSPFDHKRKKYKKKRKDRVLSTYDIDLEAEKLKEELEGLE